MTTALVLIVIVFGVPLALLGLMAISEGAHRLKKLIAGDSGTMTDEELLASGNFTLDELLAMADRRNRTTTP